MFYLHFSSLTLEWLTGPKKRLRTISSPKCGQNALSKWTTKLFGRLHQLFWFLHVFVTMSSSLELIWQTRLRKRSLVMLSHLLLQFYFFFFKAKQPVLLFESVNEIRALNLLEYIVGNCANNRQIQSF